MTAGMESGPHKPLAEADPRDCRHKRRCSVSRDTPFSPLSVKGATARVFRQAFSCRPRPALMMVRTTLVEFFYSIKFCGG
jgi:hypothetical protein